MRSVVFVRLDEKRSVLAKQLSAAHERLRTSRSVCQRAQRVIRPLCWFPFRGKALNTGNMSDSHLSKTEPTSHLNLVNIGEETVHETLTKFVDDTLTNIKKCLDKVLDLRGKYHLIPFRLKLFAW